jgi:hypothetical protein
MRVHSIEAIAIDIPLTKNFGGSTYAVRKRQPSSRDCEPKMG